MNDADERAAPPVPGWRSAAAIYAVSLAVLLAAFAVLGLGIEGDSFACFVWGRQLASGLPLDPVNPVFTTPKVLIVLLAAVGQMVPGERAAEYLYAALTAAAGAGIVVMTSRLARRVAGTVAGLVAVPLVLGHMDFIRHVVTGQSPIFASLFGLGALLLATREEVRVRDYLWAGALVFAASLARPDAFALAGGLALALYLRLGWRRPGWPAVLLALGVAGVGASLLFNQLAFGSYRYNYELVMEEMGVLGKPLPSLTVGFAKAVVEAIFHYANRLWPMLLLAAVGAGLLLGRERSRRYATVFLMPSSTIALLWLLLFKGYLINERCVYYFLFLIVALASAGIGWLASLASARGEFLAGLSPRWRQAAFVALALGVMAPTYVSRPPPRFYCDAYRALEHVGELLRGEIGDPNAPDAPLVLDETAQVMYRMRLPTDPSFREAVRTMRHGEGELPDGIRYYITSLLPDASEMPANWRLVEIWRDPRSKMGLWRRHAADRP